MKPLPLQLIYDLLEYKEDTGDLVWKKTRGGKALKNSIAGCINAIGYRQVYIDCSLFYAHRIIYAMKTNKDTFQILDHIDGNRLNNLFSNLRESTHSSNSKNRINKGVFRVKNGKWTAQIVIEYKKKHLGTFATESEAHEAYLVAKSKYHPESEGRKYG